MNQASEYGKKSKFWARFWTVWPKCGSQILFSWVLLLWDVRHCCKLLSYSISRNFFFSIRVFFKGTVDSQDRRGKGGGPSFIPLYHFHPLTNIETFSTLHVRWPSRIFNRNACVYQTATRWDLPPYQITIQVIDWWCNVCLLELILGFVTAFDIGKRWIWTHIDYHPCITSEPTNQVC